MHNDHQVQLWAPYKITQNSNSSLSQIWCTQENLSAGKANEWSLLWRPRGMKLLLKRPVRGCCMDRR